MTYPKLNSDEAGFAAAGSAVTRYGAVGDKITFDCDTEYSTDTKLYIDGKRLTDGSMCTRVVTEIP